MLSITSLLRISAISLLAAGSTMSHAADPYPATPGTTQSALSDSAITARVKEALASGKLIGISVATVKGIVALSGTVTSEDIRRQAGEIAGSVQGVQGVDTSALNISAR